MSKIFTGTTTNNVTELTLQNEGSNIGTQTIVWDNTQGTIDQVLGDIPTNWKNGDGSLKQLQIGSSCTSIGSNAFNYCSGLSGKLIIPNSVTTIGDYVFSNCSGLSGILDIPDSVTTIGFASFQLCTGLTGLVIGNNVTTIGSAAFYFSSNLTGDLIIPDSVTTIGGTNFGAAVFAGCAFTNITIGQNVTFIGDWSFGFNSGLTNVNCYITKTIIDARDQVFLNNSNFTLHARSSDNTWTAGAGQSIGGATNVTVIKDL